MIRASPRVLAGIWCHPFKSSHANKSTRTYDRNVRHVCMYACLLKETTAIRSAWHPSPFICRESFEPRPYIMHAFDHTITREHLSTFVTVRSKGNRQLVRLLRSTAHEEDNTTCNHTTQMHARLRCSLIARIADSHRDLITCFLHSHHL